ncbi:MAG: pyruvate kinase [Butyricicoccus sp.]
MDRVFHRTKIVCTVGPATDADGVLERMAQEGMNVARLNFSHGSQEEHLLRIRQIRRVRESTGLPIGLLMDTRGPEIRIHTLEGGEAELHAGQLFTLYAEERVGDAHGASVTYSRLAQELKVGTRVLVDDGKISMVVECLRGADIVCRVENGAVLKNRKSINIPGSHLRLPYISEQDRADILFGCANDVDFLAASFVRCAEDVRQLKQLLREADALGKVQIIAKIENSEGYENLDGILEEADGVMVARGDMGVEIAFDLLPHIQKTIIKKAIQKGKIVITATQMLDSMTENPRPTRAEVSDVANAVYDGTTAVMLSGETSVGRYPVETVRAMAAIVCHAEENIHYALRRKTRTEFLEMQSDRDPASAEIARAAVTAAEQLGAAAIAAVTVTGRTVRAVSCLHPQTLIAGLSPNEKTRNHMTLQFGVLPLPAAKGLIAGETQLSEVQQIVKREKIGVPGDLIVYTAGLPVGVAPSTNTLGIRRLKADAETQ